MFKQNCITLFSTNGNNLLKTFLFYTRSVRYPARIKMPKPGFYAVRVGRTPGVYSNWTACEMQIKGFPNASYKKFPTLDLANNFINERMSQQPVPCTSSSNKTATFKREITISESDSEVIDLLSDTDFMDGWDSDEDIIPVLTSASDTMTCMPKIAFSNPSKGSYYAVFRGKKPGVYKTWTECSEQIKDFKNASYRKFSAEEEALEYVRTGGIKKATKRELQDLNFDNKVIKKRKLGAVDECGYTLQNPEEPVVVFTDGASSENGKRRSRAGIGVYWGANHPLNSSKRISGRQTNNRAEIYAAVHALNQAKQIGAQKVKLYTDSQFVIHAITDWIKKWKTNGWKSVTGKEVVNKDDFIDLDNAQKDLDVEWIYVKAHARNKGNDEADRLACAGSRLVLEPANCSEFQNLHSKNNGEESVNEQFSLWSESDSIEKPLPLILPNNQDKKPFYAVFKGKQPGVYSTWTECEKQIKNFPNPKYRKFVSEEKAKEFVQTGSYTKDILKVPEYKDNEYVTIYTDGAASHNGKEGAKAGIGVYWGPENPLNTSMRLAGRQTNNRAEIYAAIHALRQAKHLGIKNVRIYTDSKFVIDGITSWIKKWKENGWKLANGKSVINKDDFMALDDACQGLHIDWCYVKGHANNPGNVEADKLAVAGCNKPLSDTIILT